MDPSKVISVMFYPGGACNVLRPVTSTEAVIGGYTWNLTVKYDRVKEAAFASLRCLNAGSARATVEAYRSYFDRNPELLDGPARRTFDTDSSYEIRVRDLASASNNSVILTMSISVAKASAYGERSVFIVQPHADVVLNVRGVRFHCNSGFMSAVSPVFGTMFSADEQHQPEVTVEDVDAASFRTFPLAIDPATPISITAVNAATIARLADRYRVSSLLVRCVVFLQNDDAISNIQKLLLLEELTQHDARDKLIMRLSPSEVNEAANDNRFLELSKECMQKLIPHNTRDVSC